MHRLEVLLRQLTAVVGGRSGPKAATFLNPTSQRDIIPNLVSFRPEAGPSTIYLGHQLKTYTLSPPRSVPATPNFHPQHAKSNQSVDRRRSFTDSDLHARQNGFSIGRRAVRRDDLEDERKIVEQTLQKELLKEKEEGGDVDRFVMDNLLRSVRESGPNTAFKALASIEVKACLLAAIPWTGSIKAFVIMLWHGILCALSMYHISASTQVGPFSNVYPYIYAFVARIRQMCTSIGS